MWWNKADGQPTSASSRFGGGDGIGWLLYFLVYWALLEEKLIAFITYRQVSHEGNVVNCFTETVCWNEEALRLPVWSLILKMMQRDKTLEHTGLNNMKVFIVIPCTGKQNYTWNG